MSRSAGMPCKMCAVDLVCSKQKCPVLAVSVSKHNLPADVGVAAGTGSQPEAAEELVFPVVMTTPGVDNGPGDF